jgi:hypothetical protein
MVVEPRGSIRKEPKRYRTVIAFEEAKRAGLERFRTTILK